MLYRMVCGKLPYSAKQTRDIYQKILDGHCIAPRQHRPELSPGLEEVILQAIRTDENLRFQKAEDFQLALVEAIPSLEQTNPVPVTVATLRLAVPPRAQPITKTSPSQALEEAVGPPEPAKTNVYRGVAVLPRASCLHSER